MARSWSVILARALTTTTGCSCKRSRTIPEMRSMACASCTEVPPNFITIMEAPLAVVSTDIALGFQQFAVQNGSACGSTNGVVGKNGKFPVKKIAGTQPSYDGSHASAPVDVQSRLRPVGGRVINHRLLRRAGQLQLLGKAAELIPRINNLRRGGRLVQLDGDRFSMPVFDRYAIAM